MESEKEIINRVASSSLITFDLEEYYQAGERVVIDIKDQLFQGIILKEKNFRDFLKANDWSQYKDKFVAITCSADAIVPVWAYMLLGISLEPFARQVVFGSPGELEIEIFRSVLDKVDWTKYKDAKIVVKGCSKVNVPSAIYVEVANRLRPFVSSLMFGEACSTVPLYKKAKTIN
jgi:hypothetical protein